MNENNDIRAFNLLFETYRDRFIYFAKTYVDDTMIAEDIVVESLMYYWENRKKLESHSNIPAYLLTVVKHKCLDYLRQRQVREDFVEYMQNYEARKLSLRIATLKACNPEKIFSKELQELVDKALKSLPSQTREIFIRSRYKNQSYKKLRKSWGFLLKL